MLNHLNRRSVGGALTKSCRKIINLHRAPGNDASATILPAVARLNPIAGHSNIIENNKLDLAGHRCLCICSEPLILLAQLRIRTQLRVIQELECSNPTIAFNNHP
ncbi:hypothetical protein D3C84_1016380 [compost metagenome]